MKTQFNNLVALMNKYNLYTENDEVGMALKALADKITEVEKRIQCVDKTAEEIRSRITKYTEMVDNGIEFKMVVSDYDVIDRGSLDILIATDVDDNEPIENNWYGLFKEPEKSNGGIQYQHCHHCSIKEEETVMSKCNQYWLCFNCNAQIYAPQKTDAVKDIIAKLKEIDVDGETMHHILEEVGMSDQMLRQLIMSKPETDTKNILEEKMEINLVDRN